MTTLSVVLISKNQEWNMKRLIKSVLDETAHLSDCEIVLVDSASTDRTTEIAALFPITVLKLHKDQHLSAAAGRYVGIKHTNGDLVLFLDGDMELCKGWLNQAISVINSEPKVGVVCGQVIDRPIEMLTTAEERDESLPIADVGFSKVLQGGGASIYRRSVLEEVATFNPFLYSDEEPELCLRIRQAGYQIIRLLRPIVFHYTVPWEALSTFLQKRRSNIWLGYGQNIRYYLGTKHLLPYLKERGWAILPAAWVTLGLILLIITIITGNWLWLGVWVALNGLILLALTIRKRSLKAAFLIICRRLLILDGTIRGFLLKPYNPASYPANYDVIRQS